MEQGRKHSLLQRLVSDVNEYFERFSKPIPLRIISQNFAKYLEPVGGLYAALEELSLDGSIRVELKESGAKVIYPKGK